MSNKLVPKAVELGYRAMKAKSNAHLDLELNV